MLSGGFYVITLIKDVDLDRILQKNELACVPKRHGFACIRKEEVMLRTINPKY